MGCNCGGSGAKRTRGSGAAGAMRSQPGFWSPPVKPEAPAPAAQQPKA